MLNIKNANIAVIGLGYVGLPLLLEFSTKLQSKVIGFDTNHQKVKNLDLGIDDENIVGSLVLKESKAIFTCNETDLLDANCYIVTVPTPVDATKKPDLRPLLSATRTISNYLRKGNIVIYESTVYPGATEEECVPILEDISGLKFNQDFFCGYSPERINPGDKNHTLTDIVKVTSGSTKDTSKYVSQLYSKIIQAGVYEAKSIKVAEAAKAIENTQRDLNIALINEIALICDLLNIKTTDVINAAATKWNFVPYQPGLVGGHCIGVDPYYLTSKAESLGYRPELILAGRRLNDEMAKHVTNMFVKALANSCLLNKNTKILVTGVTFKENCSDIRNSKVLDVISELGNFGITVDVWDPLIKSMTFAEDSAFSHISDPKDKKYEGILIAVPHNEFVKLGIQFFRKLLKPNGILFDLKSAFPYSKEHLTL